MLLIIKDMQEHGYEYSHTQLRSRLGSPVVSGMKMTVKAKPRRPNQVTTQNLV